LLTLNPTDHWRKKRASPGSPFFFTRYATIYSGQSPPFIQDANTTSKKPLVLFLDALDQLSDNDNAHRLAWLPVELPPNVKLVVSILEGDLLNGLRHRLPVSSWIQLTAMNQTNGKSLLDNWLKASSRTLTDEQSKHILDRFINCGGLPLYLKLAFEEAKYWHSYDDLHGLSEDIPGIIRDLFGRLEQESDHGKVLVSHSLGFLAASKNGLSEEELVDVLSQDIDIYSWFIETTHHIPQDFVNAIVEYLGPNNSENIPVIELEEEKREKAEKWFNDYFKSKKENLKEIIRAILEKNKGPHLPDVIWSRLYFDLEPYLIERKVENTILLTLYHPTTFGKVIADKYLSGDGKTNRHHSLSEYFYNLPLRFHQPNMTARVNLRKITELPYQLALAGKIDEENLITLLSDLDFIDAKCREEKVFELIEDLDRSKGEYPQTQLSPIRKAVMQALKAIIEKPDLTLQTIYNYLFWYSPLSPVIEKSLLRAKELLDKKNYWIRSLAPLPDRSQGINWKINYKICSTIQSLSSDCSYIAISDEQKGEVFFHSLSYGKPEKRVEPLGPVKGIALSENPRRLAWIDQADTIHMSENQISDKKLPIRVRRGDYNLLYHPKGCIFFINSDSKLVYWDIASKKTVELVDNIFSPLTVLKFIDNGNFVLVAAGNNRSTIFIIQLKDSNWELFSSLSQDVEVVDLDYQIEKQNLIILKKDRCIRIINLSDRQKITEIFYERSDSSKVIGAPACCAVGKNELDSKVYFSTNQGQVGIWDWEKGKIEPFAKCFNIFEPESFCYLSVMSETDQVFYSTSCSGALLSQQPHETTSQFHESEVLDCTITANNMVVSVGKQDNKLKWFNINGLSLYKEILIQDVSVLRTYGNGDQVIIGNHLGEVWIQSPAIDPTLQGRFKVFDCSIKDIFSNKVNTAFVANDKGQVVFYDFVNMTRKIYQHRSMTGDMIKLLPANVNGLFWSLIREVAEPKVSLFSKIIWRITLTDITPTYGADDYANLKLVKESGIDRIYHSRIHLSDIAVSQDGDTICLVRAELEGDVGIKLLRKENHGWSTFRQAGGLFSKASKASFVGEKDQWLVVLIQNHPWLTILDITDQLKPIAFVDLPLEVNCLVTSNNNIILGCKSGEILSYYIETRK
jgi:WD40 repeat protein